MCNFCPSTTGSNPITYQEHTYTFCDDCYSKAKLCDHCKVLGVFGLSVHRIEGQGFTCTSCAGGAKECKKCGADFLGDGELCRKCAKKWFVCEDCGEIKTIARSLITELEYQRRAHVLPGRNVCQKCHNNKYLHHEALNISACTRCGQYHSTNERWCPTCMEGSFICGGCNQLHHKNDHRAEFEGEGWCHTCFDSKLTYCEECGTLHLCKNCIYMAQGYVCKSCLETGCECNKCGRFTTIKKQIDGFTFCKLCASKVAPCVICDTEHHDLLEGICPNCRFELGIDHVRNYTTKMPVRLKGKVYQPHYGVENEVSCHEPIRPETGLKFFASRYHGRDVIYKHDASISNGFECVFRPFTYKEVCDFTFHWHSKLFKEHHSCGMHVHMNKSSFTTYHLYKFSKFFQDNLDFVCKIAQRKPNRYCDVNTSTPKRMAKEKESGERGILNLQNRKTIEVRIFAGVVSEAQFKKNVEFLDALYYFTKNNKTTDAVDVEKFEAWVFTQKYPNLKKFLKES